MHGASSSAAQGRARWRRRRALAATFCCADPGTMEVGLGTRRSLARGRIPPAHALKGSSTHAHPAGATPWALRPPAAAGQVLRSGSCARAEAQLSCGATYWRRRCMRSATRMRLSPEPELRAGRPAGRLQQGRPAGESDGAAGGARTRASCNVAGGLK